MLAVLVSYTQIPFLTRPYFDLTSVVDDIRVTLGLYRFYSVLFLSDGVQILYITMFVHDFETHREFETVDYLASTGLRILNGSQTMHLCMKFIGPNF